MTNLRVTGEVARERSFTVEELAALPEQVPDLSAVVSGRSGAGVRLSSLLEAAGAAGAFLLLRSSDGFSICVPRAAVTDGVVAFRGDDGPLSERQGGPLRFFVGRAVACDTGEVDACANVKALVEIHVTAARVVDSHRH
jgi:DMSO/TMAO reductase YedYZ molybdopterin-dependent catalytic subunit